MSEGDNSTTNKDNNSGRKESSLTLALYTVFSTGYVALSQLILEDNNSRLAIGIITIAPALATITTKIILWFIQKWILNYSDKRIATIFNNDIKYIDAKYNNILQDYEDLEKKHKETIQSSLIEESEKAFLKVQINKIHEAKLEVIKSKQEELKDLQKKLDAIEELKESSEIIDKD